jgi:NAD(P)-dependent dehydrogenase (short-subunit alcohol dehydrogenase family)
VTATDLQDRTFLVTGANSGIGRAMVETLAARGGNVVLAGRSEEREAGADAIAPGTRRTRVRAGRRSTSARSGAPPSGSSRRAGR